MSVISRKMPFGCEQCNTPSVIVTQAGLTDDSNVVLIGQCVKCKNSVAIDIAIVFEAFYPSKSKLVN
jgi:hypothetical protein